MSSLRVIYVQEIKACKGLYSCILPITAFLAVCGWRFSEALRLNDGGATQIQALWGLAVAPCLPILAVLLTVRSISQERASGMLEMLLVAPIRERNIVLGKYLAILTVIFVTLLLLLVLPLFVLPYMSAYLDIHLNYMLFLPTLFILFLQAAMWSAAGIMISSFFKVPVSAIITSIVFCAAQPYISYLIAMAWSPSLRISFSENPIIVHVYDFSTGLFSTGVVIMYVALSLLFLFICSKKLAWLRLRGY